MDKRLVKLSKFLSLVLRHRPEVIGLQLDAEGWLEIESLIANANARGTPVTLADVHEVLSTNDKQRFSLSEDGLRIRANQGHSIRAVDLKLVPTEPLVRLFHGTVEPFLESIRAQGLVKRSRNHVHLSADEATARQVGQRRGKPIVLTIEARRMHAAGYSFFLSSNGVWLTDRVPVEFIDWTDASRCS